MANFKSFPNERAAGQQGDLFCRGSGFFLVVLMKKYSPIEI